MGFTSTETGQEIEKPKERSDDSNAAYNKKQERNNFHSFKPSVSTTHSTRKQSRLEW